VKDVLIAIRVNLDPIQIRVFSGQFRKQFGQNVFFEILRFKQDVDISMAWRIANRMILNDPNRRARQVVKLPFLFWGRANLGESASRQKSREPDSDESCD
jgi:hypothetical protein